MSAKSIVTLSIFTFLILILFGFLLPENFRNPVIGTGRGSYNQQSFWYYPWGKSVTHKGVDIFERKGTPIVSATSGLVLLCGKLGMGGNAILILGPKWRVHYYAHLDKITTHPLTFVGHRDTIGLVGASGNAVGKPPHLHYAIATIFPYIWRADKDRQGWLKTFYLNPVERLNAICEK